MTGTNLRIDSAYFAGLKEDLGVEGNELVQLQTYCIIGAVPGQIPFMFLFTYISDAVDDPVPRRGVERLHAAAVTVSTATPSSLRTGSYGITVTRYTSLAIYLIFAANPTKSHLLLAIGRQCNTQLRLTFAHSLPKPIPIPLVMIQPLISLVLHTQKPIPALP